MDYVLLLFAEFVLLSATEEHDNDNGISFALRLLFAFNVSNEWCWGLENIKYTRIVSLFSLDAFDWAIWASCLRHVMNGRTRMTINNDTYDKCDFLASLCRFPTKYTQTYTTKEWDIESLCDGTSEIEIRHSMQDKNRLESNERSKTF